MANSKRIEFEDDIVIVKNTKTNRVIYKGMEDYEPSKDENWVYNESKGLYELGIYTKQVA